QRFPDFTFIDRVHRHDDVRLVIGEGLWLFDPKATARQVSSVLSGVEVDDMTIGSTYVCHVEIDHRAGARPPEGDLLAFAPQLLESGAAAAEATLHDIAEHFRLLDDALYLLLAFLVGANPLPFANTGFNREALPLESGSDLAHIESEIRKNAFQGRS